MSRREFPCKSCGRAIVCDDESQSIAHEVPQCAWFLGALKIIPPDKSTLVHRDDFDTHYAALARKLAKKRN